MRNEAEPSVRERPGEALSAVSGPTPDLALFSGEAADLRQAIEEHALIAIADPSGFISFVNDRLCSRLGVSRDALLGRDLSAIGSDGHSASFLPDRARALRPGEKWRGPLVGGSPAGAEFWCESTLVLARLRSGPGHHYLFIGTDITDLKRAQGAAAHLAAIVESSDDAIVGKDLQGIVTSWNKGAEKVFGYTEADMVGQPILRLIPKDRQGEESDILPRSPSAKVSATSTPCGSARTGPPSTCR